MPIYEYKCCDCNNIEEHKQRVLDVPLKKCSKCESTNFYRIISAPGIIFKGKGFHINDYSRKDDKK